MRFNPYAALAALNNDRAENLKPDPMPRANRANRAKHEPPISTISTFSTPTGPEISKENGTAPDSIAPSRVEPAPAKSDAEIYADALRTYGPSSYGALACILGWGAGRSHVAESILRKAGRISYNIHGKGTLIE